MFQIILYSNIKKRLIIISILGYFKLHDIIIQEWCMKYAFFSDSTFVERPDYKELNDGLVILSFMYKHEFDVECINNYSTNNQEIFDTTRIKHIEEMYVRCNGN